MENSKGTQDTHREGQSTLCLCKAIDERDCLDVQGEKGLLQARLGRRTARLGLRTGRRRGRGRWSRGQVGKMSGRQRG